MRGVRACCWRKVGPSVDVTSFVWQALSESGHVTGCGFIYLNLAGLLGSKTHGEALMHSAPPLSGHERATWRDENRLRRRRKRTGFFFFLSRGQLTSRRLLRFCAKRIASRMAYEGDPSDYCLEHIGDRFRLMRCRVCVAGRRSAVALGAVFPMCSGPCLNATTRRARRRLDRWVAADLILDANNPGKTTKMKRSREQNFLAYCKQWRLSCIKCWSHNCSTAVIKWRDA